MLSGCDTGFNGVEWENPPFKVICESPLEIEFEDGSMANGMAAQYIIDTWED